MFDSKNFNMTIPDRGGVIDLRNEFLLDRNFSTAEIGATKDDSCFLKRRQHPQIYWFS
jgi:hypothetical protein